MALLNRLDARHFDATEDLPFALCGRPAPLRSRGREPVHKVCAEDWRDQYPNSARFRR
ncbi:hypothetical protein ACFRU3_30115 [Streptomyces sp. NPDC056910]|uniref:hypothetical protein n=1 Tax=Streptomyces sp. NPDC056910 TaxID=3345964 RepID=UPI00367EC63B